MEEIDKPKDKAKRTERTRITDKYPAINDTIMNADVLAAYLKVSKGWVYTQVKNSALPFFKVGKGLRFRKGDVDDYLQKASTPESH